MTTKKKIVKKERRVPKREAELQEQCNLRGDAIGKLTTRVYRLERLILAQRKFLDVVTAQRDCAKEAVPATVKMLHAQFLAAGGEVERLSRELFPDAYAAEGAQSQVN